MKEAGLMSLHVLFLDDEAMICECFVELYSKNDIKISAFQSPKQAIEFAHENQIDLILLDYRMPQMSGDEVAKLMPPNIPIYLLSGELSARPQFAFAGFISKPYNELNIHKIFNHVINTKNIL